MKVLAIETSCDETAVAVLECAGDASAATFTVLGNALLSQIDIHKEYGGVFPTLAKRAHAENLTPLLGNALEEAGLLVTGTHTLSEEKKVRIQELLERETGLGGAFIAFADATERPSIDAIAITHGPGLAPALWVGVNFAKALAAAWDIPLVPINHMEGHFLAGLGKSEGNVITIENAQLPILGLLISGGHTELDAMTDWLTYTNLGATRDDAVGEAFDKVARMMGLPYPGGPEISKLAERDRKENRENPFKLPRPMKDTDDFDFSFSGLKTSVLYQIRDKGDLTDIEKEQMARAFEDAVTDVLWTKTSRAIDKTGAKTVVIGGGVSANHHIQKEFEAKIAEEYPNVDLRIPARTLSTDNAVMIGIAGYYRASRKEFSADFIADGNLSLA
ncbi:MAG TPA: tRNA (adenosine(37)-N6)-threonylcarbamoyltransferase complex transferase subunit TsaD [Candidatus Paceibacterota bacterium]|nr:tRNA (adenosine(37)-N6)-threonylcarbamoyltransferase complex transferase subunit TsaD [Candidatus Paceibacterota bacterium]